MFDACSRVQVGIQESVYQDSRELLLSRLYLNSKRLKKVKESLDIPGKAMDELLNYYKGRESVSHPVKRITNSIRSENSVDESDFKIANDALEHVFVGQRAYPPHFCGDDINWNTRPVADMEWVWQLNRMYFWNAMGKVYAKTGDEKYVKEWCLQVVDWIEKNPNDAEHNYAWRSIEAGIRGYSWTTLFYRFIQSPHFTPEVLVSFLNSCYDHAEFLMTRYRSGSNWGLMEAEGLAFIAFTFPEFKNAVKWRTEAIRRLNNEINLQVYPDGHQRELAIGYHLGCINWFYRTYELAMLNNRAGAFPESYFEKIELMCEVPMKLCFPDGTNVQFGDAWAGQPGQHSDNFLTWAEWFERDDFLYLATDGESGTAPNQTAFALKESGLYSMRSGWDKNATCLVLKCGPDGGGHCQPDNGTFSLYSGGRTLMPDAGSYIYSGDPEGRNWFRQTKVHQTLTLNDENSGYKPDLLLWQPGNDLDVLVVENKAYENLTHRRAVLFVEKKYFIIIDEAIGTGTGNVDIHFQLAPGKVVHENEKYYVYSEFSSGTNVFVQAQEQVGLQLSEEEGWVSYEYTKKELRPTFRYRLIKEKKDEALRFVTLVAPFEREIPKIKVELVGNSKVGSDKIQFKINENGTEKLIAYELK
ncbi:alginate lyase family protein [Prolixibacteraceae bacterium Z1-6]|uniref:Alginate lyase family protein n=2 Tax=Draconibacterium aestuarii TaxID=2998507 RepID=A0A9X3FAN6_9BACT|nr:alginate lyase family protein [Prolixibacteraceae bacterium Z1-6]